MRGRPVAARANFIAPSTASVPELQKNTASRCAGVFLSNASPSSPLSSEQSICTMLGRSRSSASRMAWATTRVVAPDVEDAVAAEEIEVGVAVVVVEIGTLRPDVHPVKADGALDLNERRVEVLAVQFVVLAHAGGHERFEVEGH